uniref:Uncharacterized protein n=1 Tax=Arundo donax TaxID=35708 RepID=A0A0A9GGU9_ARUDO
MDLSYYASSHLLEILIRKLVF